MAASLSPAGLHANGGPTETIAPLASSPAVDRIPLDACTADGATLTTDQRGMSRPFGDACDSGAVELTLYPTTLTLGTPSPASLTSGSNSPLIVAATLTGGSAAAPVANARIGWSIDEVDIAVGTTTGADGVATLSYDASSLPRVTTRCAPRLGVRWWGMMPSREPRVRRGCST
jgi:hypothetical protein